IVELGRQSLADPDLPKKARAGQSEKINKCLRCNTCLEHTGSIRSLRCAINPEIGFERDAKIFRAASPKKRVLVAGGGIAGMQAAITAAQRGHDVMLCEKSDQLGGILKCERGVPFKKRLDEYLSRQATVLNELGVDIRLNTSATPEFAAKIAPEVIFAAVGAEPVKPNIPGIDGANVFEATKIYDNIDAAGRHVVIIGGGLSGIELTIYLRGLGHKVTMIEAMEKLVCDDAGMHLLAHSKALEQPGITLLRATTVRGITSDGVKISGADGDSFIAADTVVYAAGQKPRHAEAFALGDCAPEFYMLGDCVTPKRIFAATQTAWTLARDI
ncbi:MAG: FAD-dependent oxidoreductase, partial [Oscillospiraceae bacterium]|nr:FAD-dependent oxidoreductase [Oscillospiraceae bacterium]